MGLYQPTSEHQPRYAYNDDDYIEISSDVSPAAAKSLLCRQVWRAAGPRCQGGVGQFVPPLMLKTDANPGGTSVEVFDGFRQALAANRAQFFLDVASGPFYGFNREGAKVFKGVIRNWWRQGMMGAANAHFKGIKAFSETDQAGDLKGDLGSHARAAGRRRSDRPVCRHLCAASQAAEERVLEDVQRVPAQHADYSRGDHQPGPARLHQRMEAIWRRTRKRVDACPPSASSQVFEATAAN
jgi:hypothetical protein